MRRVLMRQVLTFVLLVGLGVLMLPPVAIFVDNWLAKKPIPFTISRYRINLLMWLCEEYYKENGKLPREDLWARQLLILNLGDNDLISEDSDTRYLVDMFYDAWGQSFRFRVSERSGDRTVLLYSVGPNGIDECGAGDDIRVECYVKPNGEFMKLELD